MRPLPRLEAEPKSGAIFGRLFLAAALISSFIRYQSVAVNLSYSA
jgi:hypothetical protein